MAANLLILNFAKTELSLIIVILPDQILKISSIHLSTNSYSLT